jgi:gliding motility-associated lipoprotein GldD
MIRFSLILFVLLSSCSNNYTPKPTGYLRIEPPLPHYTTVKPSGKSFSFLMSDIASLDIKKSSDMDFGFNINYPVLNATLYCSYFKISAHELSVNEEECRNLIGKSAKNVDAISEHLYTNKDSKVYATVFFIAGETISPVQFMLTDSVSNFFRAALYYDCTPNIDSLAPVTEYLKKDIYTIIESFHWK